VKKVIRTRNGFLLTDFFAKQTKLCSVRTGPLPSTVEIKTKIGELQCKLLKNVVFKNQEMKRCLCSVIDWSAVFHYSSKPSRV